MVTNSKPFLSMLLPWVLIVHLATASEVFLELEHITPSKDDVRICTSFKLDKNATYHIKQFRPQVGDNVHHLELGACERPGSSQKFWNCGDIANLEPGLPVSSYCEGEMVMLFDWVYGTHSLILPDDHAFQVGRHTNYKYLFLEIHYRRKVNNNEREVDNTGVYVTYDLKPKSNVVTSTMNIKDDHTAVLPAGQQTSVDLSKIIDVEMHPMFYQAHTHELGKLVSVYVVKGKLSGSGEEVWVRLGQRDPTLPQDYVPVENDISIEKGDKLTGRCTYYNSRTHDVAMGPSKENEMCGITIIYWTKEEKDNKRVEMSKTIQKSWNNIGLNNIPTDA